MCVMGGWVMSENTVGSEKFFYNIYHSSYFKCFFFSFRWYSFCPIWFFGCFLQPNLLQYKVFIQVTTLVFFFPSRKQKTMLPKVCMSHLGQLTKRKIVFTYNCGMKHQLAGTGDCGSSDQTTATFPPSNPICCNTKYSCKLGWENLLFPSSLSQGWVIHFRSTLLSKIKPFLKK